MRVGAIAVVVWLIIGIFAAVQRGYFASSDNNCAEIGNTVLTIVAGPLNYVGINPKVQCEGVPQPSSEDAAQVQANGTEVCSRTRPISFSCKESTPLITSETSFTSIRWARSLTTV